MKVLVTGAAGFIGFFTCRKLLEMGHEVYGIDNLNDYYEPSLKYARLEQLGIKKASDRDTSLFTNSSVYKSFKFSKIDLTNSIKIDELFEREQFEIVCNLAAQAGVRYSIENPTSYIDSNVVGFLNILEGCRNHNVKNLVYASSSSVYGKNKKVPFEIEDRTDHPVSLYAATKRTNELMAHAYTHLYKMNTNH